MSRWWPQTETCVMVRRRMVLAWHQRPYTLTLAVILPVPGAMAVVLGDDVSRALSNIAADSVSRLMGTGLVVGGIVVITGMATGRSLIEAIGQAITAASCLVYGVGVLIGLGVGGVVAGSGFIAVAVGGLIRVITLTGAAREIERRPDEW